VSFDIDPGMEFLMVAYSSGQGQKFDLRSMHPGKRFEIIDPQSLSPIKSITVKSYDTVAVTL
jgi:hypothetical protein